jgi:hypothetical protein
LERDSFVSAKACSVWEHWTVRWCTGQCPVRQAGSGELTALGKNLTAYGYNSPDCPVCTGLSGEPTVGQANGRLRDPRKTRGRANGREGAPDCPVRQATEGKNCLPGLLSTVPSCLGAIKGTPRRMEENTKHSLSTLDHSHSNSCALVRHSSDLSSVLVC